MYWSPLIVLIFELKRSLTMEENIIIKNNFYMDHKIYYESFYDRVKNDIKEEKRNKMQLTIKISIKQKIQLRTTNIKKCSDT